MVDRNLTHPPEHAQGAFGGTLAVFSSLEVCQKNVEFADQWGQILSNRASKPILIHAVIATD